MILNNYKRLALAKHFSDASVVILSEAVHSIDGNSDKNIRANQSFLDYGSIVRDMYEQATIPSGACTAFDLVIGKGGTAPTADDYKLEEQLYSNIGISNSSISKSGTTVTISRTFKNFTGSSITVKEFGVKTGYYNSGGYQRPVLLTRDVLSESLTVPNNSSFTIQVTIALQV